MIPSSGFSAIPRPVPMMSPYDRNRSSLEYFCIGGESIGAAIPYGHIWKARYESGAINVYKEGNASVVFSLPLATRPKQLTLSFSFNMYVILTYVIEDELRLYWFNPFVSGYQTDIFTGVSSGVGIVDDYRNFTFLQTRHYLFYTKSAGGLYLRDGTSSYQTEVFVKNLPANKRVRRAGITLDGRLQLVIN